MAAEIQNTYIEKRVVDIAMRLSDLYRKLHSCNLESIKLSFQKSAYKLSLNKGFK